MIDKVFPRKLNSSKDARVRGKDEMIDAVNVTIDDNYDDFKSGSGVDSPSGNFGVLKPVMGNTAVPNDDSVDFTGSGRVIGSCVDERNQQIFYFLHSAVASEQGVYVYNSRSNEVTPLITSNLFNFDSNSFVDSNIVYIPSGSGNSSNEVKPILFFTDNRNEPRKIDVQRAAKDLYSSEDLSFLDFISTCPRTPIDPPVATFRNDPNTKVTNFKGNKGFQFAYQNIYKSGDVSALSTYSKLSVPFAYINQGASPNASFFSENYLEVIVPQDAMTSEVERVRLLVREGNDGSWFVVDEVEYQGTQLDFSFYNDKILSILPEGETRRQFDSVPKKARTQEVTNNRLFFGNYVEGFDVGPMQASFAVEALERPQDFISIDLTLTPEVRNTNSALGNATGNNRVAAYRLSTSELPNEGVLANTQVIFNINLNPDGNFHLYESRSGYHGSTRYNYLRDEANDFEEAEGAQTIGNQIGAGFSGDGSQYFAAMKQYPLAGTDLFNKTGVCHNPYGEGSGYPIWRSQFAGDTQGSLDNAGQDAVYGTNAGNPFIIEGKPLSFSGSFVTLADLSKEQLADAIKGMVIGPNVRIDGFEDGVIDPTPAISIINEVSSSSYLVDLGITNLQKLRVFGATDYRAKMVVAVGKQDSLATEESAKHLNPMGYFILNKATPEFRLRDISQFYAIDSPSDPAKSEDCFFALDLIDLGEFDILTCIPDIVIDNVAADDLSAGILEDFFDDSVGTNIFDGWVCMTRDHIQFQVVNMELPDFEALFVHNAQELYDIKEGTWSSSALRLDLHTFITDALNFENPVGNKDRIEQQIRRWFGFLVPEGATISLTEDFNGIIAGGFAGIGVGAVLGAGITTEDTYLEFSGGRIINTFHNYAQDTFTNRSENIFDRDDLYFDYAFSLLDGEAGAGGKNADEANGQSLSSVSYQTIKAGVSPWSDLGLTDGQGLIRSRLNCMPLIQNTTDITLADYIDSSTGFAAVTGTTLVGGESDYDSFIANLQPHVEVFDFETVLISPEQQGEQQTYKSFKTKANHDFGIVFYDQRGRSSDVTPIGNVYIPSYDLLNQKGPVRVQVGLNAITPPSWAWNYQIVYGGNSTVSDFVQYTTGGAFVEFDSDDPDNNGNIYVSLNYLQNNSKVSYSNAFGAINYDGNQDFYTYKEGDKLRIISYFGPLAAGEDDLNARVYPQSYEFDVVGTVTLADDDENPLVNPDLETPDACTGQFVILRNNPSAVNFNYNAVRNGIANNSPQTDTAAHFWNNRCVVEIYSPRTGQDAEDRVYYEISKKYRVLRDVAGNLSLQSTNIVLTEGDVYFRRLPVNMPRYSAQDQVYKNLVRSDGGTGPRFLDYYLETKTFTDTIIGANQHNWGKPKIVNPYQKEIRRDSSITFSDVNNYSLPKLNYCTFDATTSNFKDLPNSHGSIQKMIDRGDSLFILQEDKISEIPISRSIISDTVGTDIVIASEKVLGSQRFYSGSYGCSTNPESVTKIDENIYFANKEKYEVYKFNPSNGVAVISDYGLKSYFRELFKSAIEKFRNNASVGPVRVVGGYDPTLDEFVISVYNSQPQATTGTGSVTQGQGDDLSDPLLPELASEVELALEVEELEAEIGDLEGNLTEANNTINDLQQQILNLYGQINDAINNPIVTTDPNGTILDDVVSGLEDEISTINDQLEDAEDVYINQIEQSVSLHSQIRDQAAGAIQSANIFITSALGSTSFLEAEYIIPDVNADIVLSVTDQGPGSAVTFSTYVNVIEEFKDRLEVYLNEFGSEPPSNANGRFTFDTGQITLRNGEFFTYTLGYGIPTTASLSDNNESAFPEGTALFDNPNFISEFTGQSGLRSDLNKLILFAQTVALGDIEQELQDKEEQNAGLEADKDVILTQIGNFVEAVYTGRGPDVNTPPEDADAGGKNPFGDDYGSSSDDITGDSPLKRFYDAFTNGGNSALEEEILTDPLTQSAILELIEQGLLDFRFDYQQEVDDATANLTNVTAVRDGLANSLYNTAQFTFNVQRDLNNGVNPQYNGGVPSQFYSLLISGGSPSAETIIEALGGDSIDITDAQNTFYELFGSVSNILDFLSNNDFGGEVALGTGASAGLKEKIKNFLEQWDTQLTSVGFPTGFSEGYDFEVLADPDTGDGVLEQALEQALTTITGADGGGLDLTLEGLIGSLQTLLAEYTGRLLQSGFYDDNQFPASGDFLNAINLFTATAPISSTSQYNELYNAASNISEAVTRLKEFQAILGSTGLVGQIGTFSSGGLPELSVPTETSQFFPAVGYTGEGGKGLIAQTVLQGGPIENEGLSVTGPAIYTSYEGIKSLLEYINVNLTNYSNATTNQNGSINLVGEEVFFNAFNTGPNPSGDYPIFNFTGSLLDVIPSGPSYDNISDYFQDFFDSDGNPIPVDQNVLLSTINDILVSTREFERNQQRFTFKNAVLDGQNNPVLIQNGPSVPQQIQNANSGFDATGNQSIDSGDLLAFLTLFGNSVSTVTLSSLTNEISQLREQYEYLNLATDATSPDGVIGTNSSFIDLLTTNINNTIGQYLDEGESFVFDFDQAAFVVQSS